MKPVPPLKDCQIFNSIKLLRFNLRFLIISWGFYALQVVKKPPTCRSTSSGRIPVRLTRNAKPLRGAVIDRGQDHDTKFNITSLLQHIYEFDISAIHQRSINQATTIRTLVRFAAHRSYQVTRRVQSQAPSEKQRPLTTYILLFESLTLSETLTCFLGSIQRSWTLPGYPLLHVATPWGTISNIQAKRNT